MRYLTERQRDVLAFIEAKLDREGVAPTLKEIAQHFGFSSTASAQKHVGLLIKKGYLERDKHQKRGLTLPRTEPDPPAGLTHVPLLGTVAAGAPIESIADPEAFEVPSLLLRSGRHYALRVRGESMIDDGIHDGDLVLVQQGEQASDGEMVVALVGDEVTLKRLYREDSGRIRLQPSNLAMAPLVVPEDQVRVQGIVVGLLRRY
jgi:repressor LexA